MRFIVRLERCWRALAAAALAIAPAAPFSDSWPRGEAEDCRHAERERFGQMRQAYVIRSFVTEDVLRDEPVKDENGVRARAANVLDLDRTERASTGHSLLASVCTGAPTAGSDLPPKHHTEHDPFRASLGLGPVR